MQKVTQIADDELEAIGRAFAGYQYPEDDRGMFPFEDDKAALRDSINVTARACQQAGILYTTSDRHEGFVALLAPGDRYPLKAIWTMVSGFLRIYGLRRCWQYIRFALRGGEGLDDQLKKKKQKFVYVLMLAVAEPYQGQGYMRPLMEFAYQVAEQHHVPCILETDAAEKRDKYCHLGMREVYRRDFGGHHYGYELMRDLPDNR